MYKFLTRVHSRAYLSGVFIMNNINHGDLGR